MNCLKWFLVAGQIVAREEVKRMQVSEMIRVSNYCLKIYTYGTVHSGWWVKPCSENNSTLLKSMTKNPTQQSHA
jgi:hypothetical protein